MYSLNVPVPGRVARLASDLAPHLVGFERIREEHTLVCKRLGSPAPGEYDHVQARAREELAGLPPFEARVTGVEAFEDPASGPGPVVYLAVESPGLRRAHDRLLDSFPPAEGVEGEGYVPHVTLARDADCETVDRLLDRKVDPVTWTVDELVFWDAAHGGEAGRVRLPA
ncbi:phosphoesterase [Halobacteriales archaeon QS_1_68_20]|nr:MAG: phosphoesterase [Halobacteriales archaeon QS_1_68_20]